jgi:hypothetical protein
MNSACALDRTNPLSLSLGPEVTHYHVLNAFYLHLVTVCDVARHVCDLCGQSQKREAGPFDVVVQSPVHA